MEKMFYQGKEDCAKNPPVKIGAR